MVIRDSLCHEVGFQQKGRKVDLADRIVLLLLSAAALIAVLVISSGSRDLYAGEHEPLVQTIRVQQGDTLWSLADKYGDQHQYMLQRMDALEEMNQLNGHTMLRVGQTLIVPVTSKNVDI